MAFFIIVGFWIAGYARKRGRPLRAHEIDLDVSASFVSSPNVATFS